VRRHLGPLPIPRTGTTPSTSNSRQHPPPRQILFIATHLVPSALYLALESDLYLGALLRSLLSATSRCRHITRRHRDRSRSLDYLLICSYHHLQHYRRHLCHYHHHYQRHSYCDPTTLYRHASIMTILARCPPARLIVLLRTSYLDPLMTRLSFAIPCLRTAHTMLPVSTLRIRDPRSIYHPFTGYSISPTNNPPRSSQKGKCLGPIYPRPTIVTG
jgi:hypothetical protein